jgi:hypothetical protein
MFCPPWPPAVAGPDISIPTPGEGCISPQQLLLVPSPGSVPSATMAPNPPFSPAGRQFSFDFNSPLELSDSSPATIRSSSPAINVQTPSGPTPHSHVPSLTCSHCHILVGDVAALVNHIEAMHRSLASARLFCGRKGCKDVKDRRSLDRHLRTAHLGALYVCCCGHRHRKDKHRKHLRECIHQGGSPYICMCGNQVDSSTIHGLFDHMVHFEACGRRGKGRRRKDSGPAVVRT